MPAKLDFGLKSNFFSSTPAEGFKLEVGAVSGNAFAITNKGKPNFTINTNNADLTNIMEVWGPFGHRFSISFNSASVAVGADRGSNSSAGSMYFDVGGNSVLALQATTPRLAILRDTAGFGWAASGNPNSTADITLFRDAAATLALRNSTTAQILRIYNTYTDSSNYERGIVSWQKSSNRLAIGIEAAGTGSLRALDFYAQSYVFYSNGSPRWWILATGHSTPASDATYDLGDSSHRVRDAYFSRQVTVSGQSIVPLQTLTDGANIAWDCNLGAKAKVTLGGNRTMSAVTNAVEGATYALWIIQDATGSRTVTWTTSGSGSFDFGATGSPTLTTTASKADLLMFEAISIGGTLKLRYCGVMKGYT